METDAPNGEPEQPKKVRKVKKQVRKGELPIVSGTTSLDQATKQAWIERENTMAMEDKLVAETDEKKNELESFIYELRDKIDTTYSEFASEEEKGKLRAKLTETEVSFTCRHHSQSMWLFFFTDRVLQDWLYDEGEDTTKAVYVSKMEEIRFIAGPIIQRYQDKLEAERQAAIKAAEEEAARKRAEEEAKKAEEEAKKKAEEEEKKKQEAEGADTEMKDAPAPAPEGEQAAAPAEPEKGEGQGDEMKE